MAINTQNISYVFGANISQFQSAIGTVQTSLRSAGQQLKDFGSDLSAYVSLPLVALGASAIKAFGDIQSLKNGLTAVTGSADEANKQFTRLVELAKMPGLGLKEVTKGSINLQVIGFTAEKAEKSIRAFGNAVATVGGGKDQFERATYGLAQLANTDFPLGEDLNIIKDAIPQVTPLLKEAFGSARSDDLKKMGVSSAMVVDAIVDGLSKLPPVTGGVNAAFENLKDGVFGNLADIGEIINKNLDISKLVDKLINGLSSVTEYFKNLSPEVQKGVLVFAGLAIVIPPILVALGVLTGTILPALIGGFAALISPIGLVVAAVAGAVALIVYNWDSIVQYFTSGEGGKFWDTVKGYASDMWSSLKSIFQTIVSVGAAIWKKFGDNIINQVLVAFNFVKDIITATLGVISGLMKVWDGVLSGDWSKIWEGIKGITANLWNGIVNVVKSAIKGLANGLGAFYKLLGMETLGNGLTKLGSGIDSIFSKIQIPIKAATKAVKDFKKEVTGVTAGDITTSTKTTTTTKTKSTTDSKSQDAIAQVYNDLSVGLKQIDSLFGATFDEKAKKKIEEYQQAINGLIKNGYEPASIAIKNLQVEQLKFNLLQPNNHKVTAIPPVKGEKSSIQMSSQVGLKDLAGQLTTEQAQIIAGQIQFNDQFNNLVTTGFGQGIGDAFSAVGDAFTSGGNIIQAFGESIIKSFGGFLGNFGDLLIEYGAAAVLKGKLDLATLIPGAGIFAGAAAIAAGLALKLAAGAFGAVGGGGGKKGKDSGRTAFANGGVVFGPTNALVGDEYPGASRNPEVIAPLNSLKGMLSDMGGGMSGQVEFRIQGNSLVGILNNEQKKQFRTN
ncbi:tape measure protein [Pedobacter immunditicola]|uniref:tape measure protein n=1 Tax=Pedobacter immunditicola TaxID=3133440 RepID=UPI003094EC6B